MPVLRDGVVMGIIHDRKLLEAALKRGAVEARCGDLADAGYCTVSPSSEVSVVTDLLRKVRIAIVMNDEKELLGVITRIDIIDHVARVTSSDGI